MNIKRQKARVDAVKGKHPAVSQSSWRLEMECQIQQAILRTAIESEGSWDTKKILTERLQRVQAHSEEKTRIWKLFATRVTVLEVLPL